MHLSTVKGAGPVVRQGSEARLLRNTGSVYELATAAIAGGGLKAELPNWIDLQLDRLDELQAELVGIALSPGTGTPDLRLDEQGLWGPRRCRAGADERRISAGGRGGASERHRREPAA